LYSDDITITGETGTSADYNLNLNITQIPRYLASGYTGALNTNNVGHAIIRSRKLNGTDVIHTSSASEELYTINISEDDELYYISILGETVLSSNLRFTFNFQSNPGFNTNITTDSFTPGFTISRHGSAISPSTIGTVTQDAAAVITRFENFTSNSMDVYVDGWPDLWFIANFNL